MEIDRVYKYKIGDRVIYKQKDRRIKGIIVDTTYDYWTDSQSRVTVEFDDKELVPNRMNVDVYDVEIDGMIHKTNPGMDDCDCGLKFVRDGGDRHSDWCRLYKRGLK